MSLPGSAEPRSQKPSFRRKGVGAQRAAGSRRPQRPTLYRWDPPAALDGHVRKGCRILRWSTRSPLSTSVCGSCLWCCLLERRSVLSSSATLPWWDKRHRDFAHQGAFVLRAGLMAAQTALWAPNLSSKTPAAPGSDASDRRETETERILAAKGLIGVGAADAEGRPTGNARLRALLP